MKQSVYHEAASEGGRRWAGPLVCALQTILSHDGDVGARAPDLGGHLRVPPPAQYIIPGGQLARHPQLILDGEGVEVVSLAEGVGEDGGVGARHLG